MNTLYFDCSRGLTGDMIVGALCALGVKPSALEWELAMLDLGSYHLHFERAESNGTVGVRYWFHAGAEHHPQPGPEHEHHHEHEHAHPPGESCAHDHGHASQDHADIHDHGHNHVPKPMGLEIGAVHAMIQRAELSAGSKARANAILTRLSSTFDSLTAAQIAAIVCSSTAFEELRPGRVAFFARPEVVEKEDPLGAAIAAEFVSSSCAMPAMKVERTGLGIGEGGQFVRAVIGEEN